MKKFTANLLRCSIEAAIPTKDNLKLSFKTVLAAFVMCSGSWFNALQAGNSSHSKLNPIEMAKENLKNGPLLFIENKGQLRDDKGKAHPEVLFSASTNGAKVYVTAQGLHYVFSRNEENSLLAKISGKKDLSNLNSGKKSNSRTSTHRYALSLEGSNPNAMVVREKVNPYVESYYLPHCPQGITAQSFEKIRIKSVYPGVDWVIYSNGKGMKYDFELKKASDVSKIQLKVTDAETEITNQGVLSMKTSLGEVNEARPISFQKGKTIETAFIKNRKGNIEFKLNNISADEPVVIDPSVSWATYYGGANEDISYACATDQTGSVYIAGTTLSNNFPVTSGAFQGTLNGSVEDAFLVKFNGNGVRQWATYYGGSEQDGILGLTTDASNAVYAVGVTQSSDFPTSAGAFQNTFGGGFSDGLILKFSSSGARSFGTYYGNNNADLLLAANVDVNSNLNICGAAGTLSNLDVLKLRSNLTGTTFSNAVITGAGMDGANSISSDATGAVYIAGSTGSNDFQVSNAFQSTYGGGQSDGFVAKYNANGDLLWNTYLGGDSTDQVYGLLADAAGNVYVGGSTRSNNFPVVSAFQNTNAGQEDAIVAKLSSSGTLVWSTYFGGSGVDACRALTTDATKNIYTTGETGSPNLPLSGPIPSAYNGGSSDWYLSTFSNGGVHLGSTYVGGNGTDIGLAMAATTTGQFYTTGATSSTSTNPGAFQPANAGGIDGFLIKINVADQPTITSFSPTNAKTGETVTITGTFFSGASVVKFGGVNAASFNLLNPTTITAVVGVGGSGSVFVTATNGNAAKEGFTFCNLPKPTISASGPLTICDGDSVFLTSSAASGNIWSNGQTTQTVKVSTTGPIAVKVINGPCISETSDTAVVVLLPAPATSAGADFTVAQSTGDTTLFGSPFGGFWFGSGITSDGIFNKNKTPGEYPVYYGFTNSNGCTKYDVAIITITTPITIGQVERPVITPAGGSFTTPQTVTITCATPGADIYYTTNGNLPRFDVPNSFTKLYTGPFVVSSAVTVYSIARKLSYTNSLVALSTFTFSAQAQVGAISFSPTPGPYTGSQSITMTTTPADAQIFYTTNGNNPRFDVFNWFTKAYSTPVNISTSTIFRAQGRKTGLANGPISVGSYTISGGARLAVSNLAEVFPNPTSGKIFFNDNHTEEGVYSLTLSDKLGRQIQKIENLKNLETTSLDLSNFAPGVYFLAQEMNGERQFFRIIKD